jgi:hypothetical protein
VEFTKCRGDVIMPLDEGHDNAGKGILDSLKTMNGRIRKAVVEGVTIVKAGSDEGVGKDYGRVGIKRGTNLAKLSDMLEGGLGNGRYVLME